MKIKHLFLAATAIVVGFTSCTKDDAGKNEPAEKSIFIQFTQSELNTRADVGNIAEDEYSQLTSGHLYFTNKAGDVKRYVRVGTGTTGMVSPNALRSGTVIESVSKEVTDVYLYANVFDDIETPQYIDNVREMAKEVVTLFEQRDYNFGIENAILTGAGILDPISGTKDGLDYDYVAKFPVTPMIARIEVRKVTADAVKGPKAFDLDGIFINNYYEDFTLGNSVSTPVKNNGQDWTNYVEGAEYLTSDKGYLFDTEDPDGNPLGSANSSNLSVAPKNYAWAYNIIGYGEPHIVLWLKNVTLSDGTTKYINPNYSGGADGLDLNDAFLTVSRFVLDDGSADPDKQITVEGGRIYRINNLLFTDDDLAPTPEPNKRGNVLVQIQLLPWKPVDVVGKFD